jgi:hypothetical protein
MMGGPCRSRRSGPLVMIRSGAWCQGPEEPPLRGMVPPRLATPVDPVRSVCGRGPRELAALEWRLPRPSGTRAQLQSDNLRVWGSGPCRSRTSGPLVFIRSGAWCQGPKEPPLESQQALAVCGPSRPREVGLRSQPAGAGGIWSGGSLGLLALVPNPIGQPPGVREWPLPDPGRVVLW